MRVSSFVSLPPSRLSPAFASTRAARWLSAASRSPPPPPLVRGRPPSVSPAEPVGAVCRLPPGRFPVSRPRPERLRDRPALPGVAPRCRVCVGGPAAAPHPLSSARPRPPAWNRGVVSRRGASRGSVSVSRRLGGSRRVASPGSGHPPPSSRSSLPLVRPRPAVRRRSLRSLRRCVGGLRGDSRRSLGRPPSAVLVSLSARPPAWVGLPSSVCSARSLLPRVSASSLSSRSYLVDPASSICLSQRLSHACLSTHGRYSETANGSLNQLWFLWSLAPLLLG